MTKHNLTPQEHQLISELVEDGSLSAGKLAEKLQVTSPTIRSRLKNLMSRGVLRMAGLMDPFKAKGFTVALVCLTVQSHEQLSEKLEQVAALKKVNWAAIVTGRYDIMAEVILSEEISDLHRFLDEDLSTVGGINTSESFVMMEAKRKWILLPKASRR
jgi:Lrp/AsnC family transcriptional regulator for asnA, asnC and gidA